MLTKSKGRYEQRVKRRVNKEFKDELTKSFKESDRLCNEVELSMQCCGKILTD